MNFDTILPFNNCRDHARAVVIKDDKRGIIDLDGNFVVPLR
jgi:hypothetical protein